MKKQIKAEIIADSISPQDHRLTTYVLTFPRYILAELNTHRLFSKNSASSRAIPFEKMVEMVMEDPFIPMAFQKNHKGMQGTEYLEGEAVVEAKTQWLLARDAAVKRAKHLHNGYTEGVTKQLCNRLLEPFMWHTVILTASEFENFFNLRCPRYDPGDGVINKSKEDSLVRLKTSMEGTDVDFGSFFLSSNDWLLANKGMSEIHMMELAECMWDAINESEPKKLEEGEWHIPFGDDLFKPSGNLYEDLTAPAVFDMKDIPTGQTLDEYIGELKRKIATARCARVSYGNFEGKDDYKADIKLYERLSTSGHYSPFEHCAKAMSDLEYGAFTHTYINKEGAKVKERGWCRNYRGFIQLRNQID